ncbi:MAG: hypothetical protein H0S85_03560 [Desulfovibrionaceae bacterium]|jgi:hypothetical protein|nr:hypothetical protein [Desulfovibrionaceae bacterium]
MIDYTGVLDAVQQALAARVARRPELINTPGRSLACKIDYNYYLGLDPQFVDATAAWAGLEPALVRAALVRTGDLITSPDDREGRLTLTVAWPGGRTRIGACLLHSNCIDRALYLYAGTAGPLPISELRIDPAFRAALDRFLEGKSPLEAVAFA